MRGRHFSLAGKVPKRALRGFPPENPNVLICFALALRLVLSKPNSLPCMRRSGCLGMSTRTSQQSSLGASHVVGLHVPFVPHACLARPYFP